MDRSTLLAMLATWCLVAGVVAAQDAPDDERERIVAQRFQEVLEKNPRKGTALDRLYGYHVERGTLEAFVRQYADRVAKDPQDGTAWLILGLIEVQRGKDAAAVAALRNAETHLPENALASYYLGQALVLVGEPTQAAEAFERSIARKPARADLLDAFSALGRVYQRAHKSDKALEVWSRLERLFPDDLRVQEQIAATLAEEGQYEPALQRLQALAKKTKDRYRQSLWLMDAAALKVRLGKTAEALADYEAMLGDLNPDSWLHREVRRKTEEVFLRNDDQAGLAAYYESWIKKRPSDVDAMARLARTLATQGRLPEAQAWLDKALQLAPSRKDLRLAFIEQLVSEQKFAQAAVQYEALDKLEPNNPDYLREWGKLLLKDQARPLAERKQAAAATWKRLLAAKPNDPVVTTQVADLLRQAEMKDEALALYQRAVELAPQQPQYREYLGEYYHALKRSEEALATWRQIAEGTQRNAKNLTRLAEVMAGFGYVHEAVATIAEAAKLDADDFSLQLKFAELLQQAERYDDAATQLNTLARLAANDDEREALLQMGIKNLQARDKLNDAIATLSKELQAEKNASAERWHHLARYQEAAHQLPEATESIGKALGLDGQAVPILATAARIHETGGNYLLAAEVNRKLAAIDRRFRTEYLTAVAKLETRLGRREQALQAGRDLLAASPGNPEHYKFFADLCFQVGESEEGFEALRRSVRVNPSEPQVVLTLANALAERFRTEEAIELYWRAFEKTNELEGRLGIIQRLTDQYLQQNHFDKLVERLERERRDQEKQRETTLCLAQAYHAAGDFGTARAELERLLAQNPRDVQLLQQLVTLAEAEGDWTAAAKLQQQQLAVAPTREAEAKLAQLLARSGATDEASVLWVRLVTREQEAHRVLQAIDSLLSNQRGEIVLQITEKLLREQPRNWELLYREGVALAQQERNDEALRRFQAVLDLRENDDAKSEQVKQQQRPQPGRLAATSRNPFRDYKRLPLDARLNASYQVRFATRLEPRDPYGGTRGIWMPADFGMARMAALGWSCSLGDKREMEAAVARRLRAAASVPSPDNRAQWDWIYLQSVRQHHKDVFEAARQLAAQGDPHGQWLFLTNLPNRTLARSQRYARRVQGEDRTPPLAADELALVLTCYEALERRGPEYLTQTVVSNVIAELRRANDATREESLYRSALARATDLDGIAMAIGLAATRGEVADVLKLHERWENLNAQAVSSAQERSVLAGSFSRAMLKRADAKDHDGVLKLTDAYLNALRRDPPGPGKRRRVYNPYGAGNVPNYQLITGQQFRFQQIEFPLPNDYFDYGAIQVLRNAFELFRRDDLVSDLLAHYRKGIAASPAGERVYAHLALGYVCWWSEEFDEALDQLTRAAEAAPADVTLRLDVAAAKERQGDTGEALAMLDAITPGDHVAMQKRETAALRLATLTGNVDRARLAAERLFGLRLDAETQAMLASQMRQLGMHEPAEAVLARARRQAGNRNQALVTLMLQYQQQGKSDVAMQIALQILRKSPGIPTNVRGAGEEDSGRQQAMQILSRSGKLQEMIQRTEAQLRHSPKSVQVMQTLADYHRAAGNREKAREIHEEMVRLRPEDGRLRWQIAGQLVALGKYPAAIEHYKVAIQKEPGLYANNYWEVQELFQRQGKLGELGAIMDGMDVKSFGYYWQVLQLVDALVQDASTRDLGLRLYRKAWAAYPEYRSYLMTNLRGDEIWQMSEVYDFVRQAVIPGIAEDGQVDAWTGMDQIIAWYGDGRSMGIITRLMELAARQNKFASLVEEVEKGIQRQPNWSAGKALLALLRLKEGKADQARQGIEELLADKKDPIPFIASSVIAQELESHAGVQDLAIRLYESILGSDPEEYVLDFNNHPARRLVMLLQQRGNNEEARDALWRFIRRKNANNQGYDAAYLAYRRLADLTSAAGFMIQLGYPADAMKVYREAMSDTASIQLASRFYGGSDDYYGQQIQAGMQRALGSLRPDVVGDTLRALFRPDGDSSEKQAAIDLALMVQPREAHRAAVTSLLAVTLRRAADNPELLRDVRASLDALAAKAPDDLNLRVVAALVALLDKNAAAERHAAVDRIIERIATQPLEDLPKGVRANSRQRAEAAKHLGCWLVAVECMKQDELRSRGERLAAHALEAARRQADTLFAVAMLREWGQVEYDRGDAAGAEAKWRQMLDAILYNPNQKKAANAGTSGSVAPAIVVPAARP